MTAFSEMLPRTNYTGWLSPWLDKMIAWQQQGRSALEIARLLIGEGVKTYKMEKLPLEQIDPEREAKSIASIVRAALKPPKTLVAQRQKLGITSARPARLQGYVTADDPRRRAVIDRGDVLGRGSKPTLH